VTLAPGQSAQIGRYSVQFVERRETIYPDRRVEEAVLRISDGDRALGEQYPAKTFYQGFEEQATSTIAIRTNALEDLYIVLTNYDSKSASFLLVINPMVVWLWIGGVIVLVGTIFTMWPRPAAQPARATVPARGGAVAYGD
jgi:cytochrome c-type biogenesis protein CcmF